MVDDLPEKLYVFYLLRDQIKNSDLIEWLDFDSDVVFKDNHDNDKVYFYGWTTSKKLAKKFMRFRDRMKIFMLVRDVEMYFDNLEEFGEFEKENRYGKILNTRLYTKNFAGIYSEGPGIEIKIPLTCLEINYIDMLLEVENDHLYELSDDFDSPCNIMNLLRMMNKDIENAFKCLGIYELIDFIIYTNTDDTTNLKRPVPISVDEVHGLFSYFGELFSIHKKGGSKK